MEALDRVEATAKAAGFFIVTRVDPFGGAEGVGPTLRPTALLIFGKPQGGTPLMQCDRRVGIDLPLKALAWKDESGQVRPGRGTRMDVILVVLLLALGGTLFAVLIYTAIRRMG